MRLRLLTGCLAASACFGGPRLSWAQNPLAETVIETIRELDPQTAPELISAVNNLLNVGADDVAREYFLRLAQQNFQQQDLASLYHELGAATFFQLGREVALAPEGPEFAQRVVSAAKAWAENPQQLRRQLAWINDESDERRIPALHAFAEGRAQAAIVLLQQLADPQCRYDKSRLRTAWSFLGRSAQKPIMAALYTRDQALQREALQALSVIQTVDDVPQLAAYALNCQDDLLRQWAWQLLRQSAGPGDDSADPASIVEQAIVSRMRSTPRTSDAAPRVVWTWDEQDRGARSRQLPRRTAEFVEANRLCHKLASADGRYAQLYLTTELGLHHQLGREGDLRAQWDLFARRYGSPPTAELVSRSLALVFATRCTRSCHHGLRISLGDAGRRIGRRFRDGRRRTISSPALAVRRSPRNGCLGLDARGPTGIVHGSRGFVEHRAPDGDDSWRSPSAGGPPGRRGSESVGEFVD